MIKEGIQKVINLQNLSEEEMSNIITEIMSGQTTNAQIASFITALRMKGETIEEITGTVKTMRQFAIPVELKKGRLIDIPQTGIEIDYDTIVDTCGTGGDCARTFNISTAVAFVVAGCGVFVAKHGNRSVSSHCGSADVIEHLGVKLEITKDVAEKCLSEIGIVFLFAPVWHPAMKHVAPARREIGIRTIFNIAGPISNPAKANVQLLGVYSKELLEVIPQVLHNLGTKSAFVVHGEDGLDEITITGKTFISELRNGNIRKYTITPEEFNIQKSSISSIQISSIQENVQIITDILSGKEKGPKYDIVILNSAFALLAAGKVKTVSEGIQLAKMSVEKGYAKRKLELLREYTKT